MSVAQAEKLFRSFFDREPQDNEVARVKSDDDIAIVIGEQVGVLYQLAGEDKPMLHRFRKSDRPLLLVSSDGRQIYTLKGAYRFTKRGFVG